MRSAALALVLLLAACDRAEEPAPAAYDQAADPRVAALLADCARSDFYDRPLADFVPILVEKLEKSAIEPLKRAKEELAELGAEAVPELQRFVERHYSDPLAAPLLSNALDVVQLTDAPEARAILLRCLRHPSDTVRHGAILALQSGHARPEDFDLLLELLAVEIPERRHAIAVALHAADPARAEELYLDWIERGERMEFLPFVAPSLARSRRPETARRALALAGRVAAPMQPYLIAAAARAGDPEARATLDGALAVTDDPADLERRSNAVRAACDAGLTALLPRVLSSDPAAALRATAAAGLAGAEELDDDARAALRVGLDDLAPSVRRACLDALVRRGDPVAVDRAIALLEGTSQSLQEAMAALGPRLAEDPALAARVLERLRARNELEAFLPPSKRIGVLKSIGQVPGVEPAKLLRATGLEHADDEVEGIPAHQWLTIQAANTGDEGRAFLLDELAAEQDPRRRLDLLWAGSSARSDATRERLLAAIEGGELTPIEILLAADRLARIGPAEVVAVRLKRVPPNVEDLRVRVALQCLLWRWY